MRRPGIVASGAIYAMANVLSAAVPFLLLPILTRVLSTDEYGQVVSFYMLIAVTGAFAGLSLHGAVAVRWLDLSKGDPRRYTGTAVVVIAVSTFLSAVTTALLGPLLGIELEAGLCALAALVAGSNVLQGMRFAVWQSLHRPLPAAMLQVGSATLNIVLSLAAVLLLHWGGTGRILGATAAASFIAVVCIISLRADASLGTPSSGDARALLRYGGPLIPHVLAGALLTSADRFSVSGQLGAAALGIYGTASQLGMIITVLADAGLKAYSPAMYRWLSQATARSRLRFVAVAYLSAPFWVLVALLLWSALLLVGGWVLGERYEPALALCIWFLLGGAASAVYLNMAGLFFFTGKTEWVSIATVCASLLSVATAPAAVSAFGMMGGAWTYLGAQLLLLAFAFTLSLRVSPMPWLRPGLAVWTLLRPFLQNRRA